jgi:hypothetical protein
MGLKLEPNPLKETQKKPGPGQYNPVKLEKTLKYSMSGKNEPNVSPEKLTPGPGAY